MKRIVFFLISTIAIMMGCDPKQNSDLTIPDVTNVLIMSPVMDFTDVANTFPTYTKGIQYTTWNCNDSVPSPAYLRTFDAVLLFSNNGSSRADAVGDSLYAYVMDGGALILGVFYNYHRSDTTITQYWGDLETIDPFIGRGNYYGNDTLVLDGNHDLLNGLDTLATYYHANNLRIRSGAKVAAFYRSGNPAIAYNKPNGRIVAVNAFPAEFKYNAVTRVEFYRLWENALLYAAWGTTDDRPNDHMPNEASIKE
ncbi:MAG TPA: hypothetical protein PLH27_04070 [bacterium]|nr:hypothetical protein [bacterium]HMW31859.1 hypothetical protein [bacterium]HMW37069.1 hypothetical protein [bacterium]HMZ05659.1 hypothetical protein [bacterium]HNB09553.1 hypothetical protein [bacterium]